MVAIVLWVLVLVVLLMQNLFPLLLVGLLDLQLELLTVVVGDQSRRDQTLRVKLRRREDHLIR